MIAITLICPSCGRRLTVTEHAPAVLTCPSCLARIARPPIERSAAAEAPLPVIPLEYETQRDNSLSRWAIGVMTAMIAAGVGYFAFNPPRDAAGYFVFGFAMFTMLALAAVVIVMITAQRDRKRTRTGIAIVVATYFGALVAVPLIAVGVGLLILLSACGFFG